MDANTLSDNSSLTTKYRIKDISLFPAKAIQNAFAHHQVFFKKKKLIRFVFLMGYNLFACLQKSKTTSTKKSNLRQMFSDHVHARKVMLDHAIENSANNRCWTALKSSSSKPTQNHKHKIMDPIKGYRKRQINHHLYLIPEGIPSPPVDPRRFGGESLPPACLVLFSLIFFVFELFNDAYSFITEILYTEAMDFSQKKKKNDAGNQTL
ncbi:hypothetical protein RFI_05421 [Reticulomyxa filosa]|uniref:Uncharacterized protein n=1 Tax=Reticulomyxa filosa TaxID=46433 RepID=X6P0N8_RETFI|nr:hypothetical protein RFI_05421 [Reticulomyxa filosa]|eukprot:ETO31698.1 hypothetical protein RFI_05421 [Reticulomyxa filosa]